MKGWRTLAFSLAVAIVGVLQAADWATIIDDPQSAGFVLTAVGIVSAVLRALTDGPAGPLRPR